MNLSDPADKARSSCEQLVKGTVVLYFLFFLTPLPMSRLGTRRRKCRKNLTARSFDASDLHYIGLNLGMSTGWLYSLEFVRGFL
jgi:hypothetical protein